MMLQIEIIDNEGNAKLLQTPDDSIIGKGADCEVRLSGWLIGKEHARVFVTSSGVLLQDMGAFGGVQVNGKRINEEYGPLKYSDVISIGGYKLRLSEIGKSTGIIQAASPRSRSDTAAARNQIATEKIAESRHFAEEMQEKILRERGICDPVTDHTIRSASGLEGVAQTKPSYAMILAPDDTKREREFEWRKKIHSRLLETMDLRRHDVSAMTDELLRNETSKLIRQIMQALSSEIPKDLDQKILAKQVLDEAVGLGPLEELLDDDGVSEVMVNRYDEIYVERSGKLYKHPMTFTGDRAVFGVIERIVAPLGRRIDESSPMVDARLKDGSRVNAIIPPLALKGPTLTIRKFTKRKLGIEDLVQFGAISFEMAEFLQICVESHKNIIVSGGTGSGKTTLLNILSNFIPPGERIITVEDAAELKLHHAHLINLESRPANAEGKGAILIRDLVKNTLRMRPDRIVVGECRGAEALDMLQAMNTGHDGSLTTLHANTPRDAMARLETMVLMAGVELPLNAIRDQIASAVHLVVQQTRFVCGSRKVTSITELTGMESGKIQMQELFRFVSQGYSDVHSQGNSKVKGYFTGCDLVPTFYEELRAVGRNLDMNIFKPYHSTPDTNWNGDFSGDEVRA
jgi:pilus assembly protein CpaF